MREGECEGDECLRCPTTRVGSFVAKSLPSHVTKLPYQQLCRLLHVINTEYFRTYIQEQPLVLPPILTKDSADSWTSVFHAQTTLHACSTGCARKFNFKWNERKEKAFVTHRC